MRADISKMADALRITKGVDAIVHLGGYSVEGPWEGHPQRQHHRLLQRVRGGAQERREAHPVSHLEPRGGFLPAQPDHRPSRLHQARQPLRRVQGVRRGARQPLCRQVRHAGLLHAHRQRQPGADRQAAAVHLVQPARPRAARHHRHRAPGASASRSSTASPATSAPGTTTRTPSGSATSRRTIRRSTRRRSSRAKSRAAIRSRKRTRAACSASPEEVPNPAPLPALRKRASRKRSKVKAQHDAGDAGGVVPADALAEEHDSQQRGEGRVQVVERARDRRRRPLQRRVVEHEGEERGEHRGVGDGGERRWRHHHVAAGFHLPQVERELQHHADHRHGGEEAHALQSRRPALEHHRVEAPDRHRGEDPQVARVEGEREQHARVAAHDDDDRAGEGDQRCPAPGAG